MAVRLDAGGQPAQGSAAAQLAAVNPALAQLLAGAGGGPGGVQQFKPLSILLGPTSTTAIAAGLMGAEGYSHRPGEIVQGGTKEFGTLEEAEQAWYLMDDDYKAQVMEDMFSYGLIDGVNNENQAAGVWKMAVGHAWNYAQAGKDVSPTDMFSRMTSLKAGQDPGAPRTQVSKSFRYLDSSGAEALVRGAFRQAVGRDATAAELRTIAGSIVDASKANPTVTTTTTDAEGNSTSTTEGGYDPGADIANRLDNDPEAKAHQAAAELYPALMSLFQPGG